MKTLIKISWRNIWRNPKRSLVMIIAITMGLWGGIFAASLSYGMLEQRFITSIEQHISHIQIHEPEFLKDRNVKYGISQWESLKQSLESDQQVRAFSGRTIVNGMIASANLTRGANIIGVEPGAEANTTGLEQNVIDGDYLDQTGRNPILLGFRLAEKTKSRIGSRIVLTFQNADGELVAATFRVSGIFRTANSQFDERNVYVKQSDLTAYIGEGNVINETAIVAFNNEDIDSIAQRYETGYGDLSVRMWSEIAPELLYMQEMASIMMIVILTIILFALAFGLVNTMLMSVFERVREIGMLMAVGMNKKRIFAMIMLETTFLTFLGAFGGMFAGYITIQLATRQGLDLAVVGGDALEGLGFPSVIHPYLEPSFFFVLALLVVITALLTSIFPSLKALRLNPAEAVRKE